MTDKYWSGGTTWTTATWTPAGTPGQADNINLEHQYTSTLTLDTDFTTTGGLAIYNGSNTLIVGSHTLGVGAISLQTGAITIAGGTINDTGALSMSTGTSVSGYGTLNLGSYSGGLISAIGGTLEVYGQGGVTTFSLGTSAGSHLIIEGTATQKSTTTIALTSANQTLEIGSAGGLTLGQGLSVTGAHIILDGGFIQDYSGTISLSSAATLSGHGLILTGMGPAGNPTTLSSSSSVTAIGGTLELYAATSFTGTVTIDSSAPTTMKFDAPSTTTAITINNANQTLEIGTFGASALKGSLNIVGAESITNGTIKLDGGSLSGGNVTVGANALLTGWGTISAPLATSGNGEILATGGTLELYQRGGSAGVFIDDGATLKLDQAFGGMRAFEGNNGTLDLTSLNFNTISGGYIDNFVYGDQILVHGEADDYAKSVEYDYTQGLTHVGVYSSSDQLLRQVLIAGDYTGDKFILTNSGSVDSIAVACYARGTLISTDASEKPVEDLAIGDSVRTLGGDTRPIKWIGRRSYDGRFLLGRKDILPICFKTGSLGENIPKRDLWISPRHAMYFDGVLVEARDLVNGSSIVQAEHVEQVEYFHVELDSHDVILAEGALSETFLDDDSRGMFLNALEYTELYPDQATPLLPRYCAPRLAEGSRVDAIRRRIAELAGLTRESMVSFGRLRGFVDRADSRSIVGWAQNVDHPEAPVCLDVYAAGRLVGQTLANHYRQDLRQAGLGSGNHCFQFALSESIPVEGIEVRRSADGAALPVSDTRLNSVVGHLERGCGNARRS